MGTRGTTAGAGAVAVAVARVVIVLRRVLIIAFPGAAGRGGYRTVFSSLGSERPDRNASHVKIVAITLFSSTGCHVTPYITVIYFLEVFF